MIQDFTISKFIHGKMLASEKLILSYIYDHLKHDAVKSVVIPTAYLAKIGEVTTSRATAITRSLEQQGYINREDIRVDGKRAIRYSLPVAEQSFTPQYLHIPTEEDEIEDQYNDLMLEAELEALNINNY